MDRATRLRNFQRRFSLRWIAGPPTMARNQNPTGQTSNLIALMLSIKKFHIRE
jgi:hypothetical protein